MNHCGSGLGGIILNAFFGLKNCMSDNRVKTAGELQKAFEIISPFIEKHTSLVCTICEKVCCINKHGDYDNNDIMFIKALGIKIPHDTSIRKDTDPCRFLTAKGCSRDRWVRPYRCTWYFCEPLLESMKSDKGRVYREFVYSFQKLVSIRQKLLEYITK